LDIKKNKTQAKILVLLISAEKSLALNMTHQDLTSFWAIFPPTHLGSMLRSQFSSEKLAFFLKTNSMVHFFAEFSSIFNQKCHFFRPFFWGENIFKIIASFPVHPDFSFPQIFAPLAYQLDWILANTDAINYQCNNRTG
jgi:hypothetical protein